MTKSKSVVPKKRGRPATGRDPLIAFRADAAMRSAIDDWIAGQATPQPSRSEAIRRLVGLGLLAPVRKASLDERILIEEEKIARKIPKDRSPAKGMAQMRKGLAENVHRKLVAKKEARSVSRGAQKGPAASSGQKDKK
jgi:hypothetical protein